MAKAHPSSHARSYIPNSTQLRKLEVIFIDESSMVGRGMFLNLHLQQITGTLKPFGGLNLITVGDLFQLKQVFDKWIFENSKDVYCALVTNIWQEHFKMYIRIIRNYETER